MSRADRRGRWACWRTAWTSAPSPRGRRRTRAGRRSAAGPWPARDAGANAQVLCCGTGGVLVRPNDPAALAAAIGGLLADPIAAAQLGLAARRHVQTHYSRDAMRQRFEAFYERLCA